MEKQSRNYKMERCYKDQDCCDRFTLSMADHQSSGKQFKCIWKADERNECLFGNKQCMQIILDEFVEEEIEFTKSQLQYLQSIIKQYDLTINKKT